MKLVIFISISASLGSFIDCCQEGWTGSQCTVPVCATKGSVVRVNCGQVGFGCATVRTVRSSCNGKIHFYMDSQTSSGYFVVDSMTDSNPNVSFTAPGGATPQVRTVVKNSAQLVVNIQPIPGQWSAYYSSPQACMLVALQKTDLTLAIGFTNDLHTNAQITKYNTVTSGVPTYIVAHAFNLSKGKISSLQIYEGGTLKASFDAKSRSNCAYDIYFGPFTCTSDSTYYYTVIGVDGQGYVFRRTDTVRCQKAPS